MGDMATAIGGDGVNRRSAVVGTTYEEGDGMGLGVATCAMGDMATGIGGDGVTMWYAVFGTVYVEDDEIEVTKCPKGGVTAADDCCTSSVTRVVALLATFTSPPTDRCSNGFNGGSGTFLVGDDEADDEPEAPPLWSSLA